MDSQLHPWADNPLCIDLILHETLKSLPNASSTANMAPDTADNLQQQTPPLQLQRPTTPVTPKIVINLNTTGTNFDDPIHNSQNVMLVSSLLKLLMMRQRVLRFSWETSK